MYRTKGNLKWIDGLHTEQTLTDDIKEDIIYNTEAVVDEHREMIKDALDCLNAIPNKSGVGPNGESSYEIASKISKFLKETRYFFKYTEE